MQSKLDAALAHAANGYRVFPLAINGKTPAIDGNWRKLATTDPARIESFWRCPVLDAELDYNIGIALDSKTLVVDIDVRDGKQGRKSLAVTEAIFGELPPTATTITASGGEHRLFKVPDSGAFAKALATDIDLKGEGGYVVAPGSEIGGRFYVSHDAQGKLLFDGASEDASRHHPLPRADDLEQLPRIYCEEFGRRGRGDNPPALRDNGGQTAQGLTDGNRRRAVEWLEFRAPEAIEGAGGDRVTYEVACRVREFDATVDECFDLMADHWNEEKASPPWDADDLRKKIENAYSYAQDAPGKRNPEAEFDAVDIADAKPVKRKGLFFTSWPDTKVEADRPYLIDGVLEAGSMIVTYGDSNTGKTFVALDQAYHIAAGKEWNGCKVKQGAVVYVASEGGSGFAKRVEALKRHFGEALVPFYTVPCLVDLYSDNGSTAALVKLVREVEATSGQKVILIVIDTLARAMGGGDENTSTDMGKFVANCDRIRAATGAALNVVHHTGKDKARGARGSSALRAATDTEVEIAPGSLTMTKQRDAGKFQDRRFALDVVEVGRREDGAAVTSCVVRWLSVDEFSDEVSPQAEQMLDILERLIAAKHDEIAEDESLTEAERAARLARAGIDWKTWQDECLRCMKGARGKPLSRSHLFPPRQELDNSGKINKTKTHGWVLK